MLLGRRVQKWKLTAMRKPVRAAVRYSPIQESNNFAILVYLGMKGMQEKQKSKISLLTTISIGQMVIEDLRAKRRKSIIANTCVSIVEERNHE